MKQIKYMSYNPFSLEGKKILVTGSSSGIGRATAILCSQLGASVIITGRNESRLKETYSLLEGENNKYIVADLTTSEGLNLLINEAMELDGLVNNAGINKILPLQFINEQELMNTMQINALSPILLTQGLIKKKRIKKGGSVVFVSSIAGHTRSSVGNAMYCASKGTISGFVKCVAKELIIKKIRCNEVLPGQVDTPIMSHGAVTDEQMAIVASSIPMKRLGDPAEIATGIVFLLSDAASYITGSSLIIDGGLSV